MTYDNVFKSYDIRGLAPQEITEELAYMIGNALAQRNNLATCIVGRDARTTSPELLEAVIQGLVDAGVDVTNIGLCSTPQIKWVVGETGSEAGIMVSASHNPPEYNGFKILEKGGLALGTRNGLWELKEYTTPRKTTPGSVTETSYLKAFVAHAQRILAASDREVFVDPSGGVGGPEIQELAEQGDYNFTLYNHELDPTFSVHSPNPLDPDATHAAQEYCKVHNCIGVVLDADADRIVFVDEDGGVVPADFLGAWLIKQRGLTRAAATVRDSQAVQDEIRATQGTYHLVEVGHVFVQNAVYEHDLDIGVEKSGHLFLKESYCAENHLMTLLYVLKALENKRLADEIAPYKDTYLVSEEHNYRVRDKQEVLTAAQELFAKDELLLIDGVRASGEGWWVSVRASNTEPLMRLTWEARTQEHYNTLKQQLADFIMPFIAESGK